MRQFLDLLSKPAREMTAYHAQPVPKPGSEPPSPVIRLDSNENPFGPSPRAVEAIRSAVMEANVYPDDNCSQLRSRLAAQHGVPAEQVLVTAGSTGMLGLLCQTLLGPGLNAITSERSFIIYSMVVQAAGARLIEAPMHGDSYDLEAILGAIDNQTRLIFLANPNNPTGTVVDATAIDQFLEQLPKHVVVVLDEAYYEFAAHFAKLRQFDYSHSLEYVKQGASVVVLRSFSKAHGLAGLRVGYGLGPAELMAYCARLHSTFSVSSVAQAGALAAVEDSDHIARAIENNASQAVLLTESLSEIGYRVVPTMANFIYCDIQENAVVVAQQLRRRGVSVRPLAVWGAPESIRVTIGTPEQNRAFLEALRAVAAGSPYSGRHTSE
jgi:histidinol-phosphate aminotransferase